jgi:hypothetical protein
LGLGWLGAYLVLSGSPAAAAAGSNGGAITAQTFMMINGSRMGSSFIVLFVGLLYMVRGNESKRSLSIGLLSMLTTWTTYVPAMLWAVTLSGARCLILCVGRSKLFPRRNLRSHRGWITVGRRGCWFCRGVLVILLAFNLIDRALPISAERKQSLAKP